MRKTIVVGTDMLRKAAKNLALRGEISMEDYHKIDKNNENIPEDKKLTKVILE